ncbi:hypothetical protein VTG60DRAFT_6067 [Thermothelomyces hinnuleus]
MSSPSPPPPPPPAQASRTQTKSRHDSLGQCANVLLIPSFSKVSVDLPEKKRVELTATVLPGSVVMSTPAASG